MQRHTVLAKGKRLPNASQYNQGELRASVLVGTETSLMLLKSGHSNLLPRYSKIKVLNVEVGSSFFFPVGLLNQFWLLIFWVYFLSKKFWFWKLLIGFILMIRIYEMLSQRTNRKVDMVNHLVFWFILFSKKFRNF